MTRECSACKGSDKELRPYGKAGSWICFGCAMATPESKSETERNFGALLDAAGDVAVIDTRDEFGVRPLQGGKQ